MSGPPADYVEVSERIAEFRSKHPEGVLQSEIVASPAEGFIVVKAYAYRTDDDPRPGTGLAWEPVPGKTNFTRDSELMNAETSAWGRALIAVGAADAKRGIASANEVRNRQQPPAPEPEPVDLAALETVIGEAQQAGIDGDWDALRSHAATSDAHRDASIAKLRERIDAASQPPGDEDVPF